MKKKKIKKFGVKEEVFKKPLRRCIFKKLILILPVALSVSWIAFLVYEQQAYPAGLMQLSPKNTTPLVIALIIFTVGYVIFLLLMFSEEIKEMFHKGHQRHV